MLGKRERAGVQGREHPGNALAVGLVAGQASGVVDRLAALHQFIESPFTVGRAGFGRGRGLLGGHPRGEFVLRHRLDHNRHEAVVFAAQLGALAAVRAGRVNHRPHLADEAGNGVFLHREVRHPPRMQHIAGSQQEPHLAPDRQHQWVVDFEKIVVHRKRVDAGVQRARFAAGFAEIAEETNALAGIFVFPFPLVARDFDGQFMAAGVLHFNQRFGRGNRHRHQNQKRNHGPDDFRGHAVAESRGLDAERFAVLQDADEHRAEHHDADDDADIQHHHVHVVNLAADFGHAARQVEPPVGARRRCQQKRRQRQRQRQRGGGRRQHGAERRPRAGRPGGGRGLNRWLRVHKTRLLTAVSDGGYAGSIPIPARANQAPSPSPSAGRAWP